jgi:2-polyprenyl-6-methoxyphenol hydroxylase-like FAD-dependent oxidoreductase
LRCRNLLKWGRPNGKRKPMLCDAERFDVAVIGAGLAGLQCARLLVRQGFRVLLMDRKPSLAGTVQTTGIFARRTLEDFELPGDCLGPPVRRVSLYSPARKRFELESPHDEFRVGRMAHLYAHFLNECVRMGAAWLPGARYLGSDPSRGGSVIHFENQGRTQRAHVRYIVGADGTMSRVARDLTLDTNREWIVGVENVFRRAHQGKDARFHCFLDPVLAPGYIGWIVDDGEELHVGVAGYPDRFEPVRALETFTAESPLSRREGSIPASGSRPTRRESSETICALQTKASWRNIPVGCFERASFPDCGCAEFLPPCGFQDWWSWDLPLCACRLCVGSRGKSFSGADRFQIWSALASRGRRQAER